MYGFVNNTEIQRFINSNINIHLYTLKRTFICTKTSDFQTKEEKRRTRKGIKKIAMNHESM